MVNTTSDSGEIFRLHLQLTCKDFGIYAATCRACPAQYVGQTMKSFSERWNGHRAAWKSGITEDDDRTALRVHCVKSHPEKLSILLSEAFSVTFIDKPRNPRDLDIMESCWISRLKSAININKTVLPMYR